MLSVGGQKPLDMITSRLIGSFVFSLVLVTSTFVLGASLPSESWQIGPEQVLASDLDEPDSGTDIPGRPSIAFDGTNYLVVTYRMAEYSTAVIGTIVTRQGIAARTFEIAPTTPWYQPIHPQVAFGRTNYLVVFQTAGVLRGIRISPEGDLLDATAGFPIAESLSAPAVSWDGSRFLVVWPKFDGSYPSTKRIFGNFVDPSGSVSPEFQIGNSTWQEFPAVAFGQNEFMIIWEDQRWAEPPYYTMDLVGARVTTNGTVLDTNGFQVCRAPDAQGKPHIVFGGTNFFVVWHDARDGGSYLGPQIYGTRITKDGTLLDHPAAPEGQALCTTFQAEAPRAGFDGYNYFVSWMHNAYSPDPERGIVFARVSLQGDLVDGSDAATAGSIVAQIADPNCYACRNVFPEVATDGTSYFIAYLRNTELSRGPLKDVRAKRIFAKGVLKAGSINGCHELTFEAQLDGSFVLEGSTNLTSWESLDIQQSTNRRARFVDCSGSSKFYRVRQQ
jgi:hypothetical protein